MDDLAQHFNEEEMADLPALENALRIEDSRILAKSFDNRKMLVPSRSHPMAPNKPPFNVIAGFMATPFDYLGDLVRKFPEEDAGLGMR